MTLEEAQALLTETYCFIFDDAKPDQHAYRYGWAELDMGYKIELRANEAGMMVEVFKLENPDDFMKELGAFFRPYPAFTAEYLQWSLFTWNYPPAITEHRRRILKLLAE